MALPCEYFDLLEVDEHNDLLEHHQTLNVHGVAVEIVLSTGIE
jgi:hypothetical protein